VKFAVNNITSVRADGDPAEVLTNWVDMAVEAEELGYWGWWTTEHHFASDPNYRPYGVPESEFPVTDYDMAADPLTLLAWVAAKTTKLRIGTAVVILHWDHPVRVAERAALVDTLSNGRLELGVGRGAGFREQQLYKVPEDNEVNNRKFLEEIAIIRGLWAQDSFSFDGEFFQVPPITLAPRPSRELPLFIGSGSNSSAVWAAGQGLPYMTITWPLTGMDTYRAKKDAYDEAAAAAGQDVSKNENPHVLYMYCGESDEEAAETCFKHMLQFQYITESHYEFARLASQQKNEKWLGQDRGMLQNIEMLARYPIENQIVGSVETCIERVRMYQEALDVKYMVLNMGYGMMPHEKAVASMRRFAQGVMPHFADSPAPAGIGA
jgi:alkanesulfonate monooxygenase SsuD/methylene tetrahydromethanopterin reductase-like flavin-dependent oxidoreductase (luciferase family)